MPLGCRVTSPRKRRVICTPVSHSAPAQRAARQGMTWRRARQAALGASAQAHATAHSVALFYAAPDATRAAYLKDWDAWRGAGVRFEACYSRPDAAGADALAANGAADPDAGAVLVRARPAGKRKPHALQMRRGVRLLYTPAARGPSLGVGARAATVQPCRP